MAHARNPRGPPSDRLPESRSDRFVSRTASAALRAAQPVLKEARSLRSNPPSRQGLAPAGARAEIPPQRDAMRPSPFLGVRALQEGGEWLSDDVAICAATSWS